MKSRRRVSCGDLTRLLARGAARRSRPTPFHPFSPSTYAARSSRVITPAEMVHAMEDLAGAGATWIRERETFGSRIIDFHLPNIGNGSADR